jgi:2-keto-4-pentenoate hydratase
MSADRSQAAADFLLAQRKAGAVLTASLPEPLRPLDVAEARAIQLAVLKQLGPIGGWKVGLSQANGEIVASPLPVSGVRPAPTQFQSRMRGIEAEISFRFTSALPARTQPYDRAEVMAAIGTCQPAIEILDLRFIDHALVDPLTGLADLGFHGGLAVGSPIAVWDPEMFTNLGVTLTIDGEIRRRAIASNPGGTDLLRLLTGLANSEFARGAGGIEAGAVVTTGSWTGLEIVPPGGIAIAQFDGFPPIQVSFPA